jgi:hypothetical protein
MWTWVAREIGVLLDGANGSLVGVTGLAAGADSVFADVVLAHEGALHVVLAYADFEQSLTSDDDRSTYRRLLASASTGETLAVDGADEDAYLAEGRRVVALSQLLIAVWDGEPARGVGGTAEVVDEALRTATPVAHLDPIRRRVTRLGSA